MEHHNASHTDQKMQHPQTVAILTVRLARLFHRIFISRMFKKPVEKSIVRSFTSLQVLIKICAIKLFPN